MDNIMEVDDETSHGSLSIEPDINAASAGKNSAVFPVTSTHFAQQPWGQTTIPEEEGDYDENDPSFADAGDVDSTSEADEVDSDVMPRFDDEDFSNGDSAAPLNDLGVGDKNYFVPDKRTWSDDEQSSSSGRSGSIDPNELLKETSGGGPMILTDKPLPPALLKAVLNSQSNHSDRASLPPSTLRDGSVEGGPSVGSNSGRASLPRMIQREQSASVFSHASALTTPGDMEPYFSSNPNLGLSASTSELDAAFGGSNSHSVNQLSVTFGDNDSASPDLNQPRRVALPTSLPSPSALKSKPRWNMPAKRTPSAMQLAFDGTISEMPLRESSDEFVPSRKGSLVESNDTRSSTNNDSLHSNTESWNMQEPADASVDLEAEDSDDEKQDPFVLGNIQLPTEVSTYVRKYFRVHKVAAWFVRNGPCFWCCCGERLQRSSTDRAVMTRLNALCFFVTLIQVVVAIYVVVLFYIADDSKGLSGFESSFWNINGALFAVGVLGLVLMITSILTNRVIRRVDLLGAIRFLWVLLWIMPCEVFFTISLFDYHEVTAVWIRHWWGEGTLAWFRREFCVDNTGDTLCIVPIDGGEDYPSEDAWCLDRYQSTNCTGIRDDAQDDMQETLVALYTTMAGIGCFLLFVLYLMIHSLQRIISKPIVQKSRESNVPAWLTLPIVGCALVGGIFKYSPSSLLSSSSGTDNSWIGDLYLVASGLFVLAAMLGWFMSVFTIKRSSDKQKKNVAVLVFISCMATNALIMATIFIASILFSANLGNGAVSDSERGNVACFVDRGVSCTNCNATQGSEKCPEWTIDEVSDLLQTQLKQSATLAAIFIVYAISVLRFGVVLRKHLSLYQIDYV